jgi:L-fuconolactonase
MRIDSHHHFWNYSPEAYPWIGADMSVLKRDFAPADLKPLLDEFSIGGVISVQARTEEADNDLLLAHASENEWILGVVGWLDLSAPDAVEAVARFAERPKAVGLREVLQGMPERDYCLREDFNRGLAALHDFGLAYDLLIYADQLGAATRCVDKHPAQTFILDHIAKPAIGGPSGVDPAWAGGIRELAKRENVSCKLSGMITEVIPALEDWDPDLLGPWFDVVLEAFGPERLLFGSDWPVCLLRGEYADWIQCVEFWIAGLSADEQAAILGGTAKRAYGVG